MRALIVGSPTYSPVLTSPRVCSKFPEQLVLPFLWAQDGFSEPSTEMAEAIRFGLEAPRKLSMLGTVITMMMMVMMMMIMMMMMMMLQEASCCWWWGRPCAWGRCSGGWSLRRSSDSDCYCGLQDQKCHVLSFYDMIIFAVTLCHIHLLCCVILAYVYSK